MRRGRGAVGVAVGCLNIEAVCKRRRTYPRSAEAVVGSDRPAATAAAASRDPALAARACVAIFPTRRHPTRLPLALAPLPEVGILHFAASIGTAVLVGVAVVEWAWQ